MKKYKDQIKLNIINISRDNGNIDIFSNIEFLINLFEKELIRRFLFSSLTSLNSIALIQGVTSNRKQDSITPMSIFFFIIAPHW